jgi:ABC-type dipeptide/oligopeptide/nickel transport system ATPase component
MTERNHAIGHSNPVLSIKDLVIEFGQKTNPICAVDKVNIDVWPGEIVGIIGESGSGKTMSALSAMRLLPKKARLKGQIRLGEMDLLALSEKEMRSIRGDQLALIPQDAMQSLNPTMRVGRQVGEPFELHRGRDRGSLVSDIVELLKSVKIKNPEKSWRNYPHEFSGGMQQRAMIAMGLALKPKLVIADEPTTALDVTVQAEILELLREIRASTGSAIMFITHELGIVSELCDWVYVMEKGRVVESGSVRQIFDAPREPYTRMLLDATPSIYRQAD